MKKKLTVDVFTDASCPAWAMYAAVDADGSLYLYGNEPELVRDMWEYFAGDNHWCCFGEDYDASDWKNSLIKRIEMKEEERKETTMTNYERLKQMTKEELVKFLAEKEQSCDCCADAGTACGDCYDGVRKWLDSPVKTEVEYPDWAIPGNWVYNKELDDYAQIHATTGSEVSFMCGAYGAVSKVYFLDAYTEAKYRTYTVVELMELVGEKLENRDAVCLVTACNKQEGFVIVDQLKYTADELLASGYKHKNHSCGVLVHRDEDNEWVD